MSLRTKTLSTLASMFLTAAVGAATVTQGSLTINPQARPALSQGTHLAADDFRTPASTQLCRLREVEAIMMVAGASPTSVSPSAFTLRLFTDIQVGQFGRPAVMLPILHRASSATRVGQITIQNTQFTMFRVKFTFLSGSIASTIRLPVGGLLQADTRYWASVSSSLGNSWFAARGITHNGTPALSGTIGGEWFMPAATDLAMTVKIETAPF